VKRFIALYLIATMKVRARKLAHMCVAPNRVMIPIFERWIGDGMTEAECRRKARI
jgi:hypothetical protein